MQINANNNVTPPTLPENVLNAFKQLDDFRNQLQTEHVGSTEVLVTKQIETENNKVQNKISDNKNAENSTESKLHPIVVKPEALLKASTSGLHQLPFKIEKGPEKNLTFMLNKNKQLVQQQKPSHSLIMVDMVDNESQTTEWDFIELKMAQKVWWKNAGKRVVKACWIKHRDKQVSLLKNRVKESNKRPSRKRFRAIKLCKLAHSQVYPDQPMVHPDASTTSSTKVNTQFPPMYGPKPSGQKQLPAISVPTSHLFQPQNQYIDKESGEVKTLISFSNSP